MIRNPENSTFTNNGSLSGTVLSTGSFTNSSTGTITGSVNSGDLSSSTTMLDNEGAINGFLNVQGGTANNKENGTVNGNVSLSNGTLNNNGTISTDGFFFIVPCVSPTTGAVGTPVLNNTSTGRINLGNDAYLLNSQTVHNSGTIDNNGVIANINTGIINTKEALDGKVVNCGTMVIGSGDDITTYYGVQFVSDEDEVLTICSEKSDVLAATVQQFEKDIPTAVTATLKKDGYNLVGWTCDGVTYGLNDVYSASAPKVFTAIWQLIHSASPDITYTATRFLVKVYVDNNLVDSSLYHVSYNTVGTPEVDFSDTYLSTLSSGTHTVRVEFSDGTIYSYDMTV